MSALAEIDLDAILDDVRASIERAVDAQAMSGEIDRTISASNIEAVVSQALQGALPMLAGPPRLGLDIRDVTAEEAAQANLKGIAGASVVEVLPGSPAGRAGLTAGDIVIRYAGEDVRGARHLTRLVEETPAGRAVSLSYVRGRSRADVSMTPEARSAADLMNRRMHSARTLAGPNTEALLPVPGRARLGLGIQELTPQLARFFGVDAGVLVTQVTDDSPAARGGVRAGDIVTKIDDTPVTRVGDLVRVVARLDPGASITMHVTRDRSQTTLTMTIGTARTRAIERGRGRSRSSAR